MLAQACPGLVEQVEKGELQAEATRALVAAYVEPLLAAGADTLVLGCTHYPFLLPLFRAVAGPRVAIIDPAQAVARELRRRLEAAGLLVQEAGHGVERFWSSGDTAAAAHVLTLLWGRSVAVEALA